MTAPPEPFNRSDFVSTPRACTSPPPLAPISVSGPPLLSPSPLLPPPPPVPRPHPALHRAAAARLDPLQLGSLDDDVDVRCRPVPLVPLEPDPQLAVLDGGLDKGEDLLVPLQLQRSLRTDRDRRVDARFDRHRVEGGYLPGLRVPLVLLRLAFLDAREAAGGSEQDEAHDERGHAHYGPPRERAPDGTQ